METNNQVVERELGWDDYIEKESEFVLLPEGEYNFRVESFSRARFNGSAKMPACPKAVLNLKIQTPEGEVPYTANLLLHTKVEGILSAFFACIGQKKKGEKVQMNWNYVTGSTGRIKLVIKTFKKSDGSDGKSNEIKKWISKEEAQKPVRTQAPQMNNGYTQGQF